MESSKKNGARRGFLTFGGKPSTQILGSDHSASSRGRIVTQGDSLPFWASVLEKGLNAGVVGVKSGAFPSLLGLPASKLPLAGQRHGLHGDRGLPPIPLPHLRIGGNSTG